MAHDTIPSRLMTQARTRPDAPAYLVKSGGTWRPTSWKGYADEVRRAARALIALGVPPGGTVCILGFNRPEWVIADVACMCVGGAPAGIYTTCSPAEIQYIVEHAEASVLFLEDLDAWKRVESVLSELPKLRHVVMFRVAPVIDHPMVMTWARFLDAGAGVAESQLDACLESLEPGGLATLIYTSGTTGPPKGVMLSHRNLTETQNMARQIIDVAPDDCVLSYLPLSHIAEQNFTIHGPISFGNAVYFAESLEKLPENLKEVQPTVFFAVPRVWEKFHAGIGAKLKDAPPLRARIARWAMGVGRAVSEARNRGAVPDPLLALQHRLAEKLVFSKLRPAIGLGRARICVSGAAPLSREVFEFFMGFDIQILEVYGQSEDTGPTSFNRPGRVRLGTVGQALPGVEMKVASDGEILVRGANVFLGYFKDPAATAEALADGWLHSGDLGALDAQGYLTITGRKKEIIITSGGKNIAPKNIEAALKNLELVSEAIVIGDRRHYLTALVTLDAEAARKFAQSRGLPAEDLHRQPAILAQVQKGVDVVNAQFARVEHVRKFRILSRGLTIEDGELTPTMKVKRNVVAKHFIDEIEEMYAEPPPDARA